MRKRETPAQCEICALVEHDAYICARWRLTYAVNELKKTIPLLRRSAVPDMRCPFFYPAFCKNVKMTVADEVTPWPQKGTEDQA